MIDGDVSGVTRAQVAAMFTQNAVLADNLTRTKVHFVGML